MNVEVLKIPVWKMVKSGKTLELAGLIGNVCEDIEVGLQLKRKARVFVIWAVICVIDYAVKYLDVA
jgi:hypothetical protein